MIIKGLTDRVGSSTLLIENFTSQLRRVAVQVGMETTRTGDDLNVATPKRPDFPPLEETVRLLEKAVRELQEVLAYFTAETSEPDYDPHESDRAESVAPQALRRTRK